jgi:hypothetical protein
MSRLAQRAANMRWHMKNTKPNEGGTLPEAVALYVAQVPVVYHVPPLIRHPLLLLPTYACKYPEPLNVPVPTGAVPVVVEVPPPGEVVTGVPDLGRYLIPVEGQDPDCPTGVMGTNVPLCTDPRTSYEYQTSSSAPDEHWMVAALPKPAVMAAWICADV